MTTISSIVAARTPTSIPPENNNMFGAVYTHNDRGASNLSWEVVGPSGNSHFQTSLATDYSLIHALNIALGDGMGNAGTTENGYIGARYQNTRQILWASGNRIGRITESNYVGSTTNIYNPVSFLLIPLRNTTSSTVGLAFNWFCSVGWDGNGYNGSQVFLMTPNTTTYSTVTSVSVLNYAQLSTNSAITDTGSITFSLPANRTCIVVAGASDFYHTTTGRYNSANAFGALSNLTGSGVVCDQRMLISLARTRFNFTYNALAVSNSTLAPLWTTTATNYGDR